MANPQATFEGEIPAPYTGQFFATAQERYLLLALAILLLGFVNLQVSSALGVLLAALLMWQAHPSGFLALMLLYVSADEIGLVQSVDFSDLSAGTKSALDAQVAVNLLLPLRVFWELWRRPETFRGGVRPYFFVIWVVALCFAFAGTMLGHQAGLPSWTRGFRFVMMAGAYFYGFILARNWKSVQEQGIMRSLAVCSVLALAASGLHLYLSFMSFLLTGVAGMLFFRYLRPESGSRFWSVALAAGLLIYLPRSSFTIYIIFLLSMVFGWIASRKSRPQKKLFFRYFGALVLLSIWGFIITITLYGQNFDVATKYSAGEDASIGEKLEEKIFVDRMIFWISAYDQIAGGPYLVVPSGRPIELLRTGKEWPHGSHNTILELLRNTGLVGGGLVLYMLFAILAKCFWVLQQPVRPFAVVLAGAAASVAIAGITTGDYPLDSRIGFWIWSFAGLAYALCRGAEVDGAAGNRKPVSPAAGPGGAIAAPLTQPSTFRREL